MLRRWRRWDLCLRWLTQGVLLYEDNTWWWSILFKDRNLMAKYIYYQNMFNKTNESTIVETALATWVKLPRNSLLLFWASLNWKIHGVPGNFQKYLRKRKLLLSSQLGRLASLQCPLAIGGVSKMPKNGLFWGPFWVFFEKLWKQAILFPKFLHENSAYRKNKVYHDVANKKCYVTDTKKIFLDPSYGV